MGSMDEISLRQEILKGEDSRRQFKREVTSAPTLAAEVAAFLNTSGGRNLVGVDRDGVISGLTQQQLEALNQLVSHASTQNIEPSVGLLTENVTSRTELRRIFQSGYDVCAESRTVAGATVLSLDTAAFASFYAKKYGRDIPASVEDLERELAACRLMHDGLMTIAGILLFAGHPEHLLPEFCIKAVWYKGTDRGGMKFYDSRKLDGTLLKQFEEGMAFFRKWNSRIQTGASFNASAPEIPEFVFEELLTNALVHRDYFISDSVKLFVFDDRIEIRSPGRRPNSLTVEDVRRGIRRDRNPVLTSFAWDVLNYRGLGSGMLRVLAVIPDLGLQNDVEAEEVIVTIPLPRPEAASSGTHV